MITRNVAFQRNPFLRVVPAPVKNLALELSYRLVGNRPYSTTLTNPGAFPLPPEMEAHVRWMEVVLGQSYTPRPNCAVMSCGKTASVTFASIVRETEVERDFFRRLVRDGIPVKILSNREE